MIFLDSNVVVYAYDREEPAKRQTARRALRAGTEELVVSTQVLAEFFWTATRKIRRPIPVEQAARVVAELSRLRVVGSDAPFVISAIELRQRHQLALWDALIVRAAQVAGCERLLTEDLHHGARYGDVVVENPFREVAGT